MKKEFSGTVKVPESVEEAELMQKVGYAYLSDHAPEKLTILATAVEQCEIWFDEYEKIHLTKGDADKAKRNKERADFCRQALGKSV